MRSIIGVMTICVVLLIVACEGDVIHNAFDQRSFPRPEDPCWCSDTDFTQYKLSHQDDDDNDDWGNENWCCPQDSIHIIQHRSCNSCHK